MLLVNFAVQGNGEESEGGSQISENPTWEVLQTVASHSQLRSGTASKGEERLTTSCGWEGRAETPELFCRSQVVPGSALFKPALTNCWSSWLWVQWLRLLSAWKEVLCQAVLEANRAVLVHSCLWANRILESAWLYWELALPYLNCNAAHNLLMSTQKCTVLWLK